MTHLIIAAVSLALAYAFLGLAQVTEGLSAPPVHKPFWALRPTFGSMFMIAATWPLASIVDARWSEYPKRAVTFAVAQVLLMMATLSALVWGAIRLAMFLSNNLWTEVALSIAFIVALRFLMPVVNLVIIPLTILIRAGVDLFFPLKTER